MIPLSRPSIGKREEELVLEVLRSGQLAFGKYVEKFESMFTEFLGVRNAIACSSGTMGLYVCLCALDNGRLSPRPACFLSRETFGATMNAVSMAWCSAFPVDAIRYPGHLSIYIPCHIFGEPAPDFASSRKVDYDYMIEDACESLGVKYHGEDKYLGTFGDMGVFAFYANKQISSCGEGGMIVTDNDEYAALCRKLINQGRSPNEPHTIVGTNARMTDVQAAMGVAQMERLDEILEKRRAVAQRYIDNIDAKALKDRGLTVPVQRDSWFAFPLNGETDVLRNLHESLKVVNVQSAVYFPEHEVFSDGFIWNRRLCLPFYTDMEFSDTDTVSGLVNDWARR